jgi:hypothetical protein
MRAKYSRFVKCTGQIGAPQCQLDSSSPWTAHVALGASQAEGEAQSLIWEIFVADRISWCLPGAARPPNTHPPANNLALIINPQQPVLRIMPLPTLWAAHISPQRCPVPVIVFCDCERRAATARHQKHVEFLIYEILWSPASLNFLQLFLISFFFSCSIAKPFSASAAISA